MVLRLTPTVFLSCIHTKERSDRVWKFVPFRSKFWEMLAEVGPLVVAAAVTPFARMIAEAALAKTAG